MAGRQRRGLQRQLKAAAAVAVQRHRERGEPCMYCTYWDDRHHPQQPGSSPLEVGHPISSGTPMSAASPALGRVPASASTGNMHPGTPR